VIDGAGDDSSPRSAAAYLLAECGGLPVAAGWLARLANRSKRGSRTDAAIAVTTRMRPQSLDVRNASQAVLYGNSLSLNCFPDSKTWIAGERPSGAPNLGKGTPTLSGPALRASGWPTSGTTPPHAPAGRASQADMAPGRQQMCRS
jgi:hypothetical protein